MTEEVKHYKYGGSTIERISICPGSAHVEKDDTASDAAERGTRIHAMVAELLGHGRREDGWEDSEWETALLAAAAIRKILAEHGYDSPDATVLVEKEVRCEDIHDDAGGSADVLGWKPCHDMIVIDLKTGYIQVEAVDCLQLLYYAMCALRSMDDFTMNSMHNCRMIIVQTTDDEIVIREWVQTIQQVKDSWLRFQEIIDNAENNPNTFVPGFHCSEKFCDAQAVCPTYKAYLDEKLSGKFTQALSGEVVEPAELAGIMAEEYKHVGLLEKFCKALKAKVLKAVQKDPDIWSELGYETASGLGHRKWTNEEEAFAWLKKHGIPLAEAAPRKAITPAAAERIAEAKGVQLDLKGLTYQPSTGQKVKKAKKSKSAADEFIAAKQ